MKKIISIFCATLLIVVVASTVCVGCNEAEHKFAKDLSYDETYHYRVCTDNGCNEKKDKAEHVFGEWTVTEEASTTKQGLKERACNECGYKKREIIPMCNEAEHKFAKDLSYDETYHYRVCTDNGCNEKKDKAEHVFGEWTVTEEASTTKQGLKERACSECGYKKREIIPMVAKPERTIKLKSGITLDKVYDGNSVAVSADNFEYDGGGEITFMFARNGSEEWFSEAPKEIGKYTVKVTVAETGTHKGATETFGFEIKKPAAITGNYKNFTVTDANGKAVKLSEFIGKPIVVNFWAAWCAPCKAELPHFDKLAKELKGKVEFLMVSVYLNKDYVKQFVSQNGYTFPLYFDDNEEGSTAYEVTGIPVTVFITADGNIKSKAVGSMSEAVLRNYIDRILN